MTTSAEKLLRKRDAVVPVTLELVQAQVVAGSMDAVFDKVLPGLDLRRPPPDLRSAADLLRRCEAELCPGGHWHPEEHPLGLQRLREQAIILLLSSVRASMAEFQEALADFYGLDPQLIAAGADALDAKPVDGARR